MEIDAYLKKNHTIKIWMANSLLISIKNRQKLYKKKYYYYYPLCCIYSCIVSI